MIIRNFHVILVAAMAFALGAICERYFGSHPCSVLPGSTNTDKSLPLIAPRDGVICYGIKK